MMVAAWVVTIALRRFAARFGLLRYVWHPALFVFAVYMIVLSSIVRLSLRAELAMTDVDAKRSASKTAGNRRRLVPRVVTRAGEPAP